MSFLDFGCPRRYKASYGCITIRSFPMNSLPNRALIMSSGNYLAGHTKKYLRLKAKRVSDLKAFVELPVELQILVRTTCKNFGYRSNPPAGSRASASN